MRRRRHGRALGCPEGARRHAGAAEWPRMGGGLQRGCGAGSGGVGSGAVTCAASPASLIAVASFVC